MPHSTDTAEGLKRQLAQAKTEIDRLGEENEKLRRKLKETYSSGQTLFTLADNSPFPTAVFDPQGKLGELNARFVESFGYLPEDMPDRSTWFNLLVPDPMLRQELLREISQWRKRHKAGQRHHDVRITCKNGTLREVVANVFEMPDGWLYVALEDMTSKKRNEEYIRQSEARFRASFDSAPSGMALISPERRFLAVNNQLCSMLGYKAHEMIGKSFNDFTHPEDRQGGRDRFDRILRGVEDSNMAEKRYQHKDGSVVWVLVSNALIRDKSGRPLHFVSHFLDLSQRKMAEAESLERERLTAAIETAGASCHELNQPLQVALAQTEVTLMSIADDDPLKQRMEGILSQINRISSITRRLQNLTQYRTKTYLGNTKILDLDKSSE